MQRKGKQKIDPRQDLAEKYRQEAEQWKALCVNKDFRIAELEQHREWAMDNAQQFKRLYQQSCSAPSFLKPPLQHVKPETEKKATPSIRSTQPITLICIDAAGRTDLDEFSRYTSYGIVKGESGREFFPIIELNGSWAAADQFHISGEITLSSTGTVSEARLLAYQRQQRLLNSKSNS